MSKLIAEAIRPRSGAIRREIAKLSAIRCDDPHKTLQSQKDEADINMIMKRFGQTGLAPSNVRRPILSDYGVTSYMDAMNLIIESKQAFLQMPADVRTRFRNDPALFVAFCSDEKNLPEMRKMGIAVPEVVKVESPPMKVEVVNPK